MIRARFNLFRCYRPPPIRNASLCFLNDTNRISVRRELIALLMSAAQLQLIISTTLFVAELRSFERFVREYGTFVVFERRHNF